MLSKEVRQFLAAYLDVPEYRVNLFAQRMDGLKKAHFPETGMILDIIHQLVNLPPHVREDILVLKRGQSRKNNYQPRSSRHWA